MSRAGGVWLVKLGGSLVTDKTKPATADAAAIEGVARQIAAFAARREAPALVLGHGSGSFGHRAAATGGVGSGPVPEDRALAAARVGAAVADLHAQILEALVRAGVAAFSIRPSAMARARSGSRLELDAEPFANALRRGLVPLTCGDLVLDEAWGVSIASTEAVFSALAGALNRHDLRPGRAVWLGRTAGLLDGGGRTVPEIGPGEREAALALVGRTPGVDVTGGMALRLRTAFELAALGVESWLADGTVPGILEGLLAGERVSATRILPDHA